MAKTFVQPYLFFGGKCDEALAFYQTAVGARVEMLMRYSDSPQPPPPGMLAAGFENKVMHTTFHIGDSALMASDGDKPGCKFEGFRLSLTFPAKAEAERAFNSLAEGGSVLMPLSKTFWSPCFGMLTDRFGLGWMITVGE